MARPVIGLTTRNVRDGRGIPSVSLLRAYLDALVRAGGAPLLIPSGLDEDGLQALYGRLDGVLFTGGGDVALDRFEAEPHPSVDEVDPERDAAEFALLEAAARDGKPFLGICRGCQVVNVGLGGTLYTHIADQLPGALKHDYYPDWRRDHPAHPVSVTGGSHLANILDAAELTVNSLHHQGVRIVPAALRPAAHAPDGLVEALELPGHPFGLAVQWHPEWLPDQPAAQNLFRAFAAACEGQAQRR